MILKIGCIVEGQGEVAAVPVLIRRIAAERYPEMVIDSDDDCPAQLGPALLYRASQVRANLPIAVVLAKREFETWFLAAAESLRGKRGLKSDINPPDNPEAIRGAKEWLERQMETDKSYREKRDQPALAAQFDLQQARQVDSFDKCYRDIVRLLEELQKVNDFINE